MSSLLSQKEMRSVSSPNELICLEMRIGTRGTLFSAPKWLLQQISRKGVIRHNTFLFLLFNLMEDITILCWGMEGGGISAIIASLCVVFRKNIVSIIRQESSDPTSNKY